MSKFTSGPWEAFVSADVASVVKNKQGLGIARVIDDYDAYLIAAAPAMYEALRAIEGLCHNDESKQRIGIIADEALRAADGGK